MRKEKEILQAYNNARQIKDSDYHLGYTDAMKFVLELNRRDNIDKCGSDGNCTTPNSCRVDNGYSKYCKKCQCRNCTKSDCHPETKGF